jgi:hypothetical protein
MIEVIAFTLDYTLYNKDNKLLLYNHSGKDGYPMEFNTIDEATEYIKRIPLHD